MALNFTPIQYSPFEHSGASTPEYDQYEGGYRIGGQFIPSLDKWNQEQNLAQQNAFQGYAGNQFQGLVDSVNNLGSNPMVSGSAYNNAPQYTPYGGTPAQFTTGTQAGYMDGTTGTDIWKDPDGPTVFDSGAYYDAQFSNINDYLGKMGSFFGNMGSDQSAQQAQQAKQNAIARQAFQASLPQAPQMNFQQSAPMYTGGGWGQQSTTSPMAQSQTPAMQPSPMATYRGGGGWGQQSPAMQQAPIGTLGTTNRGSHGGILGGTE